MMESEYQSEQKRLKTRFKIIYIGSIVLLSLFFGALWLYHTSTSNSKPETIPQDVAEKTALLNMDKILHESLMKMDGLTINYSKLLAESPDSASLDSINNLINTSQIAFSNLVDKMYSQRNLFKNPLNANKSDSIIYAFISALNSQKANNALRMAFAGNDITLERDSFAFFQSQMNMQTKSDSIMNLRNQLKFQNQFNRNSFPTVQSYQNNSDIDLLKAFIKAQKDSLESLLALYNLVTKDKNNLATQLNKLKSNTNSPELAEKTNQIKALNDKVDDLYADLSLAKIDCNLTRANGKDIIYNSRQRKDLLQESLTSLKGLANSNNPVIQRKVKEKMELLQNIAATVRD